MTHFGKYFWFIYNLIFLMRFNKDVDAYIEKNPSWEYNRIKNNEHFFSIIKIYSKRGIHRNLTASILRKIRERTPIRHIECKEEKERYEAYFRPHPNKAKTLPIDILKKFNKKEEVFITLIHKEYPIKNGYVYDMKSYRNYGLGCYQLVKSSWNDFYIQSVDNTRVCTFDQEWITAFRYSTEKEIKNFKKAQSEIEQIEEEYKKINNQANKVYQQKQLISFKFYR